MNTLSRFLYPLLCLKLCLFIEAKPQGNSIESFLPGDAVFSIVIDDFDKLEGNIMEGPWGTLREFPVWDKVEKWIEDEFGDQFSGKQKGNIQDIEDNLLRPVFESMKGGVGFAIGGLENLAEKENLELAGNKKWTARKMPRAILVFDSSMSSNEYNDMIGFLEDRATSKKLGNLRIEKEETKGVEVCWFLHKKNLDVIDLDRFDTGFCLFQKDDKIFILLGGKDLLAETIGGFEDGSLHTLEDYDRSFESIEKGQARMFINFKPAIETLKSMMDSEKMKFPQNPFGINSQGLIAGLGVDGLDQLGIRMDASNKEFSMASSLHMNHRKGILSFLSEVKNEVELHEFVPANALSVTNARLDLGQFWPKVEDILKSVSPALHLLVSSQIQAFEDQAEVSVRKDLFGSMGDQWLTISYPPSGKVTTAITPSPGTTLYAISLKDSALFDRTLRAVFDAVGKGSDFFQEREHKGITIRSMRGLEAMGMSMGYAIADEWLLLVVGQPRYLNQLINQIQSSGKNSLWQVPEVSDAMDDFPSGIRQIDYVDFQGMLSYLLSLSEQMNSADEIPFELSEDDFGSFPFFMLGWSKDTDDGIISEVRMLPSAK